MKTIRLIELFAGYGSQAMALKRLGLPFQHHFVCEFDKYAVRSYNAVHDTDFPTIDIKDVHASDLKIEDRENFTYLLTYSFPCTDLSVAGNMQGMSRESGTRSGLLWEVERILKECGDNLPDFLLMENVPQVHGVNNVNDFNEWICFLDGLGYKSKWQDLNAKDFGVAQNRDRCFMVSWLQPGFCFQFPQPFKLEKTMKDYLEKSVDEKYYLKSDKAKELIEKLVLSGELERDQETVDLSLDNAKRIETAYSLGTIQRGITNAKYKECGIVEQKKDVPIDLSLSRESGWELKNANAVAVSPNNRTIQQNRNSLSNGVCEVIEKNENQSK